MYMNYYLQLSTGAKKGFSIQFWLTLQVAFQAPPPFFCESKDFLQINFRSLVQKIYL